MPPTRVLLADDHDIFRAGLRTLIDAADDFEVVGEASSGPEAVRLVEQLTPDVLVLDMQMPPVSGADVAREVRERGLSPLILVLSAFEDGPYVDAMRASGAAGYVTKSRSREFIVMALREVAAGRKAWFVENAAERARLTDRERDILAHMARGYSNLEVADALNISEPTVRNTLTCVYQKIGVSGARAAVSWAWANRLVTPPLP